MTHMDPIYPIYCSDCSHCSNVKNKIDNIRLKTTLEDENKIKISIKLIHLLSNQLAPVTLDRQTFG
jgi:hypothetical protein